MRPMITFTKKEWLELIRSNKLTLLFIIFILFGIMNPALAKLTPMLYEMMADTMKEQGITIAEIKVDALTSWMQYFKNAFMELLVLACLFCGILTTEYQKGTLIPMLTKGLSRSNVLFSKFITTLLVWSGCYYLCFGITYAYNAYFWDNSIAEHLGLAAFCIYLLGVWLITIIFAMSAIFSTGSAVLLSTGGIFAGLYFISLIPKLSGYLPVKLLSAGELVTNTSTAITTEQCYTAITATCILSILNYALAHILFRRKRL